MSAAPIRGYVFDAYLTLACFPEVKVALARLSPRRRAIRSKGSPRMLAAAAAWCNREGAPEEELGIPADFVIGRLDELPR